MPFFHHLPPDFRPWGFPQEAFLRQNGRACSSRTGKAGGLLKFQLFRRYNQAAEYAVPWVNRVAPLKGAQVVEIGCGSGSSTAAFARLAKQVYGYDINHSYIDGANRRAQVLGLTNVLCHAVPPDQLLTEVRRRHGDGQVDLVLLYAVLEHCTTMECLETIKAGWDLLRPGGHLVVIETPNRFGYMDVHTTYLPFFHMLPSLIALRYYHRVQRQRVIKAFDAAIRVSEHEAELARIRLGTGISYHDFQIALGVEDLGSILAADGYEPEMLAWFPITLEERLLQTFFLARDIPVPIGFARFVLNVILRKPVGCLPDEPLIPAVSRTEFTVNFANIKVESPAQQHARLLQEFNCLKKIEFIITGKNIDLLVAANQVHIAYGGDHIQLQSIGNDPYLYLSPLLKRLSHRAILKIDIDAPDQSILQIFYLIDNYQDYAEERSVRVPLHRGRQVVFMELPAGMIGRLRLDPGEIPGVYHLYMIELRQ